MARRNRGDELVNLVVQAPGAWEQVKKLLTEVKKLNDKQFRMFQLSLHNEQLEREVKKSNEFHIGDIVKFSTRGRVVHARITGYGRRRMLAQEVSPTKPHNAVAVGGRWKVPATMLEKVL